MRDVDVITDQTEIQFPRLGWTFHVDHTAFKLFGVEIQWYGILITVGLILALVYAFSKMKRFGIDPDRALDVSIVGIIGGIIGARVYYVINKWEDYKGDWKEIFNVRGGGLAIYGGIIGAFALGLLMCRIRKVRMLPMLDITVLGLLIGQGIGRWGNFVNQEAFGTNTDCIFGMTGGGIQSKIIRQSAFTDGDMLLHGIEISERHMVHPCFLYESFWCLLGFFVLAWFSKHRKYDGQVFLMYLSWYGAERFFVEGLRTDSLYLGNSDIRVSQVLSAIICITSLILQIIFFLKRRRDPEAFVLYVNTEESHRLIEETRRKMMGMPAEDRSFDDDDDDIDYDAILSEDDDDDEDEESEESEENENIKASDDDDQEEE